MFAENRMASWFNSLSCCTSRQHNLPVTSSFDVLNGTSSYDITLSMAPLARSARQKKVVLSSLYSLHISLVDHQTEQSTYNEQQEVTKKILDFINDSKESDEIKETAMEVLKNLSGFRYHRSGLLAADGFLDTIVLNYRKSKRITIREFAAQILSGMTYEDEIKVKLGENDYLIEDLAHNSLAGETEDLRKWSLAILRNIAERPFCAVHMMTNDKLIPALLKIMESEGARNKHLALCVLSNLSSHESCRAGLMKNQAFFDRVVSELGPDHTSFQTQTLSVRILGFFAAVPDMRKIFFSHPTLMSTLKQLLLSTRLSEIKEGIIDLFAILASGEDEKKLLIETKKDIIGDIYAVGINFQWVPEQARAERFFQLLGVTKGQIDYFSLMLLLKSAQDVERLAQKSSLRMLNKEIIHSIGVMLFGIFASTTALQIQDS